KRIERFQTVARAGSGCSIEYASKNLSARAHAPQNYVEKQWVHRFRRFPQKFHWIIQSVVYNPAKRHFTPALGRIFGMIMEVASCAISLGLTSVARQPHLRSGTIDTRC